MNNLDSYKGFTDKTNSIERKIISHTETVRPNLFAKCALFLFTGSILFENVPVGNEDSNVTVSRYIGYLLIVAALLQPKLVFRRPPLAIWFFVTYLVVLMCSAFLAEPLYESLAFSRLISLFQTVAMCYISFNLMKEESCRVVVLSALAISGFIAAALTIVGVGREQAYSDRITAFGQNPNIYGNMLSMSIVAAISLGYGRARNYRWAQIFSLCAMPVMGIVLIQTSSRGSMVALIVGLVALVFQTGKLSKRLLTFFIFSITLLVVLMLIGQSKDVINRWMSVEQGSLSGRERIFPEALQMFMERPVLGWGIVRNYHELGSRFGLPSLDTHNNYLWVLTEVGLVGSLPFFVGLILCFRSALLARRGTEGIAAFAWFALVIVTTMNTNFITRKVFWLAIAYSLASVYGNLREREFIPSGKKRMT